MNITRIFKCIDWNFVNNPWWGVTITRTVIDYDVQFLSLRQCQSLIRIGFRHAHIVGAFVPIHPSVTYLTYKLQSPILFYIMVNFHGQMLISSCSNLLTFVLYIRLQNELFFPISVLPAFRAVSDSRQVVMSGAISEISQSLEFMTLGV